MKKTDRTSDSVGEMFRCLDSSGHSLRRFGLNLGCQVLVVAFFIGFIGSGQGRAAPPSIDEKQPGQSSGSSSRWIDHIIVPGDRLSRISDYYGVSVEKLIRWNKLNPDRPWLRAGSRLRMLTNIEPMKRKRIIYKVKPGDSWYKIAKRFEVDTHRLQKYWNRKLSKQLRVGQRVVVWIVQNPESSNAASFPEQQEASQPEQQEASQPEQIVDAFSIVTVPDTGLSVGAPGKGRLMNGVQLPKNEQLYKIRNPTRSYGSSHTVTLLQKAIANFRRDSGFEREIVICDMSAKRGGRISPHNSHRSGRDVDIRLPLKEGIPLGTIPLKTTQVDWNATWELIKALLETSEVQYIFLARNRQKILYHIAQEDGTDPEQLKKTLQYPNRDRKAIIRHSTGHIKHIHVRFKCAEDELRCTD